MTAPDEPDSEQMLYMAASGDPSATQILLDRHRGRLKKMVAVRLDPRLTARVDPSDIVQDALLQASQELPRYLQSRPIPFYPWLRQIAWECLVQATNRHLHAQKRTVLREQRPEMSLSDDSMREMANRFVTNETGPSEGALRNEVARKVRLALRKLSEVDREVLVLRYLEQLSTDEIAAVTGIGESGVKSRQRRAVERLRDLLVSDIGDEPR